MEQTVALDCRWLAFTGAGRVTELLLRGFHDQPPSDHWLLWGSSEIEPLRWAESQLIVSERRPNAWRGQRDWSRIPRADLVLFMHQQRPLRPVPAVTMILDTTPIHFPNGPVDGFLKRQFLKRAAQMSRGILTISSFSRSCIESDLGVPASKIDVLNLPADHELSARVLALRDRSPRRDVALYLGLFLAHKNIPRLLEAFGRTEFCKNGGRLLLVGGKAIASALWDSLDDRQRHYVEIRPRGTEAEIEELLATSRFLVQPSLVEGFGLPVWEALACGLPVCVSDGGALPEITHGLAEHFPARSIDAMTEAIDTCARTAEAMGPADHAALAERLLSQAPSISQFAGQFEGIVRRYLEEERDRPARAC